MKISNITLNNFTNNFKFKKQNNFNKENSKQNTYKNTTGAQYLAFCGGYSINLSQTYQELKDEQYPKDIRESVIRTIKNGNLENKTLYDIHFKKYKDILDCYSLDELKEKFPEFKDVISAKNIETTPDSFIGKFQNNELELFPNDEDLTLQLIKLYWGQGFSLTDLSNYIAKNDKNNQGTNLYYAMAKKLNIPMMNRRYALVLKLSNKEYNEKFTTQMSIRLKEAKEAKLQKAQGEAVVIPKGELSEAHKEHISQGLKKYYQEHPEKIYEMSQRQQEFYQQNPKRAEELSEVALFAWHKTQEGESVLKGLRKFMKKNNSEISIEELANPLKIKGKKRTLLDLFWKKNGWAKEKFSIAMKKAWANQKEKTSLTPQINMKDVFKTIEGEKMRFSLMPSQIRKQVLIWAKEVGYDTSNLVINEALIYKNEEDASFDDLHKKNINFANKITNEFLQNNEQLANARVSCLIRAIVKLQIALKEGNKLPASLQGKQEKLNVMDYKINFLCYAHDFPTLDNRNERNIRKEYDSQEIEQIYSEIMNQAIALECYDFGEYMDKLLDKAHMELKAYGKI